MPVNEQFPASIIQCESREQFFASQEMRAGEVTAFLLEHEERLEDAELEALSPWSDEDRARMGEFQDQRGKTSWCISRFAFRNVISRALGVDASELTLETGPFGKPYLSNSLVAFNWAHTPGCLLLAVSNRQEIGCDIEDSHRRRDAFRDIARDYFSRAEQRWIDEACSAHESWIRFLATFVEKEARLKAIGYGISESMNACPTALQIPPYHSGSVYAFRFPDGRQQDGRYLAAVCSQPEPRTITVRTHRLTTSA